MGREFHERIVYQLFGSIHSVVVNDIVKRLIGIFKPILPVDDYSRDGVSRSVVSGLGRIGLYLQIEALVFLKKRISRKCDASFDIESVLLRVSEGEYVSSVDTFLVGIYMFVYIYMERGYMDSGGKVVHHD